MPPNIRRALKEITPPILLRLRSPRPLPEYATFDDALADSHSYQDPGLIEIVSKKTQLYIASLQNQGNAIVDRQTIQNLFVLGYVHPEKSLEVVELGGACGAMYALLNLYLPGRLVRWRIVETPAMAEIGRQLFQTAALTFHNDLNAAAQGTCRDLLMAQGVIQYTRDPIRAWNDLFQLDFDFVYVTRTLVGVDLAQPVITKQIVSLSEHGPGAMPVGLTDRITSQPLTIVPREALRVPANYRVAFAFVESPDTVMRIGGKRVVTRNLGWLIQKIHR